MMRVMGVSEYGWQRRPDYDNFNELAWERPCGAVFYVRRGFILLCVETCHEGITIRKYEEVAGDVA